MPLGNARGNLDIDLTLAAVLVEGDSPLGAGKRLLNRDIEVSRIRIGLPGVAAACARTAK